ncbi:MAG: response regulator [Candidatus Binatia bacterium]
MKLIRDLSIKYKLVLMIVTTSAVVLLFTSAAVVFYDASSYKRTMVEELAAHADIIAHNSAAALTFDDRESAAETLEALQATVHVMTAYILDPAGRVFSRYVRDETTPVSGRPLLHGEGYEFFDDRLALLRPIVLEGERLGAVYIEADLTGLGARVRRYAAMSVAVVACALILAVLLSSRFQRLLSGPILALAETAKIISRQKNYGLRAVKTSGDEVGTLIDGFNEMLEQIQEQDAKLERHRDELEREVGLRTSELRDLNVRLKDSEARIRAIVEGTSATTGVEFFDALTMTLARALGMRRVIIGRLVDVGTIEAQAMWDGLTVSRGDRYAIEGTPCEVTMKESFTVFEDGVADEFPRDPLLADWKARSYVGVALRNSAGLPIGILVALNDTPLPELARDGSLLRVFASRAAAELERMMVEEELLLSESRTRAILDSAADAIITIGDRGAVETFNVAAEQIFGYSSDEIVGSSIAMLMRFPHEDPRNIDFVEHPEIVLAELCGKRSELEGLRGHGSEFAMNIVVSRMCVAGRDSYTAIIRDITRERELEQMKTDFVSTVSHEIRTPLSCIISSAKILERNAEERPDVARKFSGIIAEEGKRLSRLINDLLNLSKMDTGGLEWTFKEADAADLLRQAVTLHRSEAREHGVSLSADTADGIDAVKVDRDKFVQVTSNLIRNAIKFTGNGGKIELTAEAWRDGFVCVTVGDTGVGIAAENRRLIFDRFKQIGDILTDRPQGSGLGLPVCKELVEYWGGEIWVESEPGRGSRFRFTIPAAGARKHVSAGAAPHAGKVLVVDDEPATRDLVTYLLERNGFEVVQAADGAEALELARIERPALITLDIMMPGMNGYEVLQALRGDPALRDVPVLLMSVLSGHVHSDRGLELGANAFLGKPVGETALIATAERLVGKQGKHVVIVHADEKESTTIRGKLTAQGYNVALAFDEKSALERVSAAVPDLVILGPPGGGIDGNGFVRALRSSEASKDVPVLMLTEFRLDGLNAAYFDTFASTGAARGPATGDVLSSVIDSLRDRGDEPSAPHRSPEDPADSAS